jgi:hypothetical protein
MPRRGGGCAEIGGANASAAWVPYPVLVPSYVPRFAAPMKTRTCSTSVLPACRSTDVSGKRQIAQFYFLILENVLIGVEGHAHWGRPEAHLTEEFLSVVRENGAYSS